MNDEIPALRFDAYEAKLPRFKIMMLLLASREHAGLLLGSLVGIVVFGFMFVMPVQTIGYFETGQWEYGIATWLLMVIPAFILLSVVPGEYREIEREVRLQAFAESNSFLYQPTTSAEGYPGVIFGQGHSRRYRSVVSGVFRGLPFEFGNYNYVTGSGKHRQEHHYGVLGVKLSRQLPHVLLDSRRNNSFGFSNLPAFSSDQRLDLEGDFNKYFNLYVPKGYERDALYFLSPELMQLLVDHGEKFDVELVDDYLFIYSSGRLAFEKQETVQSLLGLISVIGREVEENTARYADERIGAKEIDIVAEPGRRLARPSILLSTVLVLLMYVTLLVFDNTPTLGSVIMIATVVVSIGFIAYAEKHVKRRT